MFARLRLPLFLILALLPLAAQADDQAQRAGDFIQKLGDKAIAILADQDLAPEEAGKRFRNILQQDFDLNLLGRFALGRNGWRAATPRQRKEYLKLFEELAVQIYSERLRTYNNEVFKVGKARPESGTDSYVTSFIARPDAGIRPTQVDWRVRDEKGRIRIIDVIVEGVSMSVTKRSEFMAALQQAGGDFNEFLNVLRRKTGATGTVSAHSKG